MEKYRQGSHCIYDIKYQIVWVTKYRKPVLGGNIGIRIRELLRRVCQEIEVGLLGHISKDHVRMLVSGLPTCQSVSKLVQYMKGYTSRKLQMEYKELNKQYRGRHLWTKGYLARSSGNILDEVILEYIKNQEVEKPRENDNFEVGGMTTFSR